MENLVEIVESRVMFDAELLRIRSVDADAPDDKEIEAFCQNMSAGRAAHPAAVAEMICSRIMRTGKTAREVMREMEEWIHE